MRIFGAYLRGNAGGERFQTIIVDVERKEINDLPYRRVDTIKKYLRVCDPRRVGIVERLLDMGAK